MTEWFPGKSTDQLGADLADAPALRAALGTQVADEITDPATPMGAVATSELSPRVAKRPVVDRLSFTETAQQAPIPCAVGIDGAVYARAALDSNRIVRSSDGFATAPEAGFRFADLADTRTLRYATRTAEGYVAMLSDDTAANDSGAVYFSTSFATGWTKVLDCGYMLPLNVARPVATDDGTIMLFGEYGNEDSRDLYLSEDGGQTWRVIRTHTRQAGGAGSNNHWHGSAYDPVTDRIYASGGDGANNWFGYSEDWREATPTWVDVPADGVGPEDAGTIFNHPTVVATTSQRIVTTPDGNAAATGVWELDRTTGRVNVAHEVVATDPYRHFCRSPWAQDDDVLYLLFPPDTAAGEVDKVFIAATGDGGKSWHTVWTLPVDKAADLYHSGMVGPDAAGRIFVSAVRSTVKKLYVASQLAWEAATPAGHLTTGSRHRLLDAVSTDTTVVNTTAATDVGRMVIPAGVARPGDVIRAAFFGTLLNNTAGSVNYTFAAKLGATTLFASAAFGFGQSALRRRWRLVVDILVTATGGQVANGDLMVGSTGSAGLQLSGGGTITGVGHGTASEDLASNPKAVAATVTLGTADAAAEIVLHGGTLELLQQ